MASRRDVLRGIGLTGAAVLGGRPLLAAAEPPPEPTDAVRFWALRLHEAGLIKSGPNKIIAQGTDWRFFNELKKELKG